MAENVSSAALTPAASAVSPANLKPATAIPRKKKRPCCRMVYGYPVDHAESYEKAIAAGDSAAPGRTIVVRAYRFRMLRECRKHWRRASLRIVDIGPGHRQPGGGTLENKHVMCISLAENTSQSAMERPPRAVLDKLKTILQTDDEPKWYRFVAA